MTQSPQQNSYRSSYSQKRGNGLGVAALVLGICALVGSPIPFLNFVTGFIAFVGLVLGIIGVLLKGRKKGTAIAGTIISAIAMIVSITLVVVYTASFLKAVDKSATQLGDKAGETVSLVYEVTGESTDSLITYATFNDGKAGTEQQSDQALPFTKTIPVKKGGVLSFSAYTLSGSNGTTSKGSVSCKITLDGAVIAEQASSGPHAIVSCFGSGR